MDVHWVDSNGHAEHTFPHCALRTPRLPQRVMGWSMLKMAQQGRIPRRAGRCAQTRQPRHESMFAEFVVAVAGWRRVSMRLTPYWRGS